MKKHIATHTDTHSRCVVVMLQIPGREDHALAVQTDGLPPRFEQTLMSIVESAEGQSEPDLANVLARRIYQDTGKTVLQTLHEGGLLSPVHVDKVTMLPHPNMPFPLRVVLTQMGRVIPGAAETAPSQKFNPIVNNMQASTIEERMSIARNLLMQADDLSANADRKRNEAYKYAPELRPAEAVAAPVAQTIMEHIEPVTAFTPGPDLGDAPELTPEQIADLFMVPEVSEKPVKARRTAAKGK